ncbi:MAG: Fic family protein [Campylobacterales bacterium]|nr:Fic family protein [Campylobacterales bacterium]
MTPSIHTIIHKIFDDYDEKNGAQQKIDYTDRASKIVYTWTQGMNTHGLTTELICELHRIVCDDVYIPVNDPQGGISGFSKAGEYRTTHSSAPSLLHKGSQTLFLHPQDIATKMEQLATIMNGVFISKLSEEWIKENIVAFTVEFLTVHPFANQNGRIAQVLMELLAYRADLKPFNISYVVTNHYEEITKSVEEVLAHQSVKPFLNVIDKVLNSMDVAKYAI